MCTNIVAVGFFFRAKCSASDLHKFVWTLFVHARGKLYDELFWVLWPWHFSLLCFLPRSLLIFLEFVISGHFHLYDLLWL